MVIKMLLFPVVLLLVLYFIIAQVVPTAQSISSIKEEIINEEASLQSAKEDVARAEAFKGEIEAHSAEQNFISEFVPNDQKEETLLSDVSQLATQSGVNLFSMGFSEGRRTTNNKVSENKAYLIEGKMIVSGTYEDMNQFMNQLFRIKRLYAFKTFDLTKVEQNKSEEGESAPALMLNGVISFAYDYMPGMGTVSSSAAQQSINFDLITNVMNASSETEPLNTETKYRSNPFLP